MKFLLLMRMAVFSLTPIFIDNLHVFENNENFVLFIQEAN